MIHVLILRSIINVHPKTGHEGPECE